MWERQAVSFTHWHGLSRCRTPESPHKCLRQKRPNFVIFIRMKFGGLYPFFGSILSGGPALSALWIWPQKNCGRLKKFLPRFAGYFWGSRMYYIPCIYVVQWLYMYLFSFKFIIHDFLIILCRFLAFIESFDPDILHMTLKAIYHT